MAEQQTQDDPEMLAADARLDQEAAELRDYILKDLRRWRRLMRKISGPAGDFKPSEILIILRLAEFAGQVLTGRLLDRKV